MQFRLIDLTHVLDPTIPTWRGGCGFSTEIKKDYDQGVRVQSYRMAAGIGTHLDAPSHFIPGGKSIAEIPLEELCAPLCVIDITSKCSPETQLLPEDIVHYEKKYGKIPEKSIVIANTGWSKFWSDPNRYRNPDQNGIMHFPHYSKESAELLLERNVCGIGLDTLSPDPHDSSFPVHHLILGAGKHILENVANLERLPPQGSFLLALPLNITDGAESPVRAIALLPT